MKQIRALSWKQPFAQLMLHGKIETRTWSTAYRGPVLICSSKTGYSEKAFAEIAGLHALEAWRKLGKKNERGLIKQFSWGNAIAIGQLIDCRPMVPSDAEKCFVKYRPGLYCHVYDRVQEIEPFPWKGSLGWRTLDQETIGKIKIQDPTVLNEDTLSQWKWEVNMMMFGLGGTKDYTEIMRDEEWLEMYDGAIAKDAVNDETQYWDE